MFVCQNWTKLSKIIDRPLWPQDLKLSDINTDLSPALAPLVFLLRQFPVDPLNGHGKQGADGEHRQFRALDQRRGH